MCNTIFLLSSPWIKNRGSLLKICIFIHPYSLHFTIFNDVSAGDVFNDYFE